MNPGRDIWHDDDGVWEEIDGKLVGPFATEALDDVLRLLGGEEVQLYSETEASA